MVESHSDFETVHADLLNANGAEALRAEEHCVSKHERDGR
jgi:head-tail adaptor